MGCDVLYIHGQIRSEVIHAAQSSAAAPAMSDPGDFVFSLVALEPVTDRHLDGWVECYERPYASIGMSVRGESSVD